MDDRQADNDVMWLLVGFNSFWCSSCRVVQTAVLDSFSWLVETFNTDFFLLELYISMTLA